MNIGRILRCLQMIKTKRSLYLIYEDYPQWNLEGFLAVDKTEKSEIMGKLEKSEIMEKSEKLEKLEKSEITEKSEIMDKTEKSEIMDKTERIRIKVARGIGELLRQVHRKGYIYGHMVPSLIFVVEGLGGGKPAYELKFAGFQYTRKLKPDQKSVEVNLDVFSNCPYVAPEILQTRRASVESDVYSYGKILEMMGFLRINEKNESKMGNQIFNDTINENPSKRPPLSKILECLKIKQAQIRSFEFKSLQIMVPKLSQRKKQESYSIDNKNITPTTRINSRRGVVDQERRLKKVMKIRNLVIYLHDLANFCLKQKNKVLFFMLFKKSVIVRANLVHELKKMVAVFTGEHNNKLNSIKQVLVCQQNNCLDFLSKIQQSLRQQSPSKQVQTQLQTRNQLNQQTMQQKIHQFVKKKKKQIKPFHSILDEEERGKLINLCGLAQKLVYGSFQKFFDEVIDDFQIQLYRQKYFLYLKTASTKEIFQRLDKILGQGK